MLLPGPEAQQLATYIGWLLHRSLGGVVAGVLFVLPSLLLLIGLSWIYVVYGNVAWVAGLLYGVKPAVAALVLHAANDPFVPAYSLPRAGEVGPCVTLWQPPQGGHVGFPRGGLLGDVRRMPEAVVGWLAAQRSTTA